MKSKSVSILAGGGGSPEQSQRVVFRRQLDENYSQTSARRGRPRSYAQARALAFNAKGGEPAEATEWHPYLNPCVWTTIMRGFTMAEILLSLTIIGVVAAITLPSLTGNINERTWNTQRKALYARMSQAIALMPALNGYGTLTEGDSSTSAEDTAAETFVTAGLAKVLKINNICDSEHLEDCGIADNIVTLKGNTLSNFTTSYNTLVDFNSMFAGSYSTSGVTYTYSQLNTKAAAFETQNGESIVVYYNPNCVGDMGETERYFIQPKMCANFVYDLNASKGPNTVGKDIGFLTVMYPSDSVVVAPVPLVSAYGYNLKYEEASQKCRALDSESRLPNREEIVAMFVNRNLLYGTERTGTYWTTSSFVSNSGILMWGLNFNIGHLFPCGKNATSNYYWCIKR